LHVQRDPRASTGKLYEVAASQGGYFTAAQARAIGYAYSQHHYHVSRGTWIRVGHGLFRLRDFPASEREDLIRWSMWSRNRKGVPQAVVSHETALTVHGLSDVMPARVHLTVPNGFRKRVPPGAMVHRGHVRPSDVEARVGYRVTTPLRTLLDVAGSPLSQEHLDQAVRDAVDCGLVRRKQLREALGRLADPERLEAALEALHDGEPGA
jgi:predicted transcriptional regulator of viral defense system